MKRMIDTGTWDDPWFAELDPESKLFFLYLLTNRRSTAAGAFEITIRAMSFETGIPTDRVKSILDQIESRVAWWPQHQIIWVRKFFKHQAANENFLKSAQSVVKDLPRDVQCAIGSVYPNLVPSDVLCNENTGIGTHPNGYPTGTDTPSAVIDRDRDTEEGREEQHKKDGAAAPDVRGPDPEPAKSPKYTAEFETFWKAYPSGHGVKKTTFEYWKKIPAAERQAVMDGLNAWKACDRWQRGFVRDAQRWLRDRMWEDEPPAAPVGNSLTVHNGGSPGNPDDIRPGPRGYTMDQLRRKAELERQRAIS